MFMCCIPISDLQCACATQPFPRDDARKNSVIPIGPATPHKVWTRSQKITREESKNSLPVEVKKQDTLERDE